MKTAADSLEYIYAHGVSGLIEFYRAVYPDDEAAGLRAAAVAIDKALDLQKAIMEGTERPLQKRHPYHHEPPGPEYYRAVFDELRGLGLIS